VQKTMTMLALDDKVKQRIAASAEADSVVVPDIRGLDVLTADTVVRRLGLSIQDSLPDSGMVMRQKPLPGARVERRDTVYVELQLAPARPDVIGLSLRRAITVLHAAGYEVRVKGTGRVTAQEWSGSVCTLIAQGPL